MLGVREHRPYVWIERILGDMIRPESSIKRSEAVWVLVSCPLLSRSALAVRGLVRVRHEKR